MIFTMGMGMIKWTRPIVKMAHKSSRFLIKNSNVILTVLASLGVAGSVGMAVRGTIKAVKLYEEKQPHGTKETVLTVWKCYIPTIGMAILTTTAIVCNGRINAKKIAVLTASLSGSMDAMKKMEEKMAEMIGPKKAQAVIDEMHSSNAEEHKPQNEKDIISTGHGEELFFIEDVGQWIYSDVNHIELAELKTKDDLQESNDWDSNGDGYILMNDALDHLGAKGCYFGNTHGWNAADLRELGMKGPKFRVSSKRMDINGVNRAVGTIWFEPEATPI